MYFREEYPYMHPWRNTEEEETTWPSCSQGHRSSLSLETSEGGSICLVCFCNLISNPASPTVHVSYALSQLSLAISHPPFLQSLRSFHAHLLISPLVQALSSFDDEQIARQAIDLVDNLCDSDDPSVFGDFIARITERLSSAALSWSRRQVYPLHCLGVLLNRQTDNTSCHIKDKGALIANLVTGLQLPSEEIRGEIFFVLYKLAILQDVSGYGDETDNLLASCPKLLYISLEALMKTQSDEVRLNCVALLTVLAQRGYFEHSFVEDLISNRHTEANISKQGAEVRIDMPPLIILFAEAIKAPLLSSDPQVQIGTVDLIFHCMSWDSDSSKHIQALVEESIADYVFEILRLSGYKDPVVISCLRVLGLLSTAEKAFKQRLAVGFPTLVPILRYVAEVPFHPVQSQLLKLIWSCIFDCPGIVSRSQLEELVLVLTGMFKRHTSGEMGMLPEVFTMACSIFVALLKSPSSHSIPTLRTSLQEAMTNAILSCLCVPPRHPNELIVYSLYLLKEIYAYSHEDNLVIDMNNMELGNNVIELCKAHILPWLVKVVDGVEEEIILGVLETFHLILLQESDVHCKKFAESLASSSWFSLSFGCLGLFPTENMKWRVYLMLSSIIDRVLGHECGQPIRDAASYMPSDPLDLLFLLGQKSSHDLNLISCQSAVLSILYASSLYDERLADDKQVLASLEQYVLLNSSNFLDGIIDSVTMMQLVHLYSLFRGIAKISYQIPYSPEAEKLLLHLVVEKECNILCWRIHPRGLKWLFQQEGIIGHLSHEILSFCRSNGTKGTNIINHGTKIQMIEVEDIAKLVQADDNHGAILLVSLLKHLQEEVQPKTLFDDEVWFPVAIKLLEFLIPTIIADTCNHEGLLVLGIFSLILHHHSTNGVLPDASKAILLNTSLASKINNAICAACSKGYALVEHDAETVTGETLIFVLLLNFFSLRSLHALLPENLDWLSFLQSSPNGIQPLSFICICCHDLCRLMHFGSPPVKLVASHCLLEMMTTITDQRHNKHDELKCSMGYLKSVMSVLEGLVFNSDTRVAMNSALCLSMILGWEKLGMQEASVVRDGKWCRLVVEELVLSLTAPGLASTSFRNYHKPASKIAIALLRLDQVPKWMPSVFDHSCISGIIKNLSASNVSAEMARLFRELLIHDYLNAEQILGLNGVFQACRKHVYKDNYQKCNTEEHLEKVVAIPDDLSKISEFLLHLISSDCTEHVASGGVQTSDKKLLEEIEMFFQESSARE
ncbi:PREDICTED: protein PRD1 isoform X2 [Nelumbo nucifera]|uniref:Protein PRD1 isoform X2 n=2 Tax=Nelumbo nucifera TaxID=4432 RepID=A0A1U8BB09_NELNU|nr:PREDICTED: protein PRD1 isoform X2 [Nelumbo nucifera]DAD46344.1 TPA_asm: hypothetical protein HUJ06_004574 [Nelumbo nucifera]